MARARTTAAASARSCCPFTRIKKKPTWFGQPHVWRAGIKCRTLHLQDVQPEGGAHHQLPQAVAGDIRVRQPVHGVREEPLEGQLVRGTRHPAVPQHHLRHPQPRKPSRAYPPAGPPGAMQASGLGQRCRGGSRAGRPSRRQQRGHRARCRAPCRAAAAAGSPARGASRRRTPRQPRRRWSPAAPRAWARPRRRAEKATGA